MKGLKYETGRHSLSLLKAASLLSGSQEIIEVLLVHFTCSVFVVVVYKWAVLNCSSMLAA